MGASSNQEKELDQWERALQEKLAELQLCQKEQNLQSCFPCKKLLECPLRDAYVKAVYESMNKGSGGGFEF